MCEVSKINRVPACNGQNLPLRPKAFPGFASFQFSLNTILQAMQIRDAECPQIIHDAFSWAYSEVRSRCLT
jgi:hypothetical protein